MSKTIVTRLAPSPTGDPHLGNAWSFLLCWLAARSAGGIVHLRMDDIDPQRSRTEHAEGIIADLRLLGLDWDSYMTQSGRGAIYENALERLAVQNLTYPCFCTRKELRMLASAPHIEDRGVPYPGTCSRLTPEEAREKLLAGKACSTRLRCGGEKVFFEDLLLGPQNFAPVDYGNDFALRRSDGVFAYQLATAVDDGLTGVNLVARGRDLVSSTPRQILIMRALGLDIPSYAHLPLLLDENGERLAKRHAALSLKELWKKGISGRRVVGYLGALANLTDKRECSPQDLLSAFSWEKIPRDDIKVDLGCL